MAASVVRCPVDAPDPGVVERAAAALRDGRLVAIPTETVYGLGANALDPAAVAAVFAAKGRPATDPLIVHVDGPAMARGVIDGPLAPPAAILADALWPGPLTLVLPRHRRVPAAVSSGLDTVAVRCPSHPVATAVITAAGTPIAAPSANRFGHISPTAAHHVMAELGDRIDLIVDGGRTDHGLESTVVAFDGDAAVVLRPGAVTVEELATHVEVRAAGAGDAIASPGHDNRHYSPRTPTVAVAAGFVPSSAAAITAGAVHAGYTDRPPSLPPGWRFEALGSRDDLDTLAHHLYDRLRRLDETAPPLILVELTDRPGLGRAIDDRLSRAGSSEVMTRPEQLREYVADGT